MEYGASEVAPISRPRFSSNKDGNYEEGGIYAAECAILEAIIVEIHKELTTKVKTDKLSELFETMERSAGSRPTLVIP